MYEQNITVFDYIFLNRAIFLYCSSLNSGMSRVILDKPHCAGSDCSLPSVWYCVVNTDRARTRNIPGCQLN